MILKKKPQTNKDDSCRDHGPSVKQRTDPLTQGELGAFWERGGLFLVLLNQMEVFYIYILQAFVTLGFDFFSI